MVKGKNKNYQRIDNLIVGAYNDFLRKEGTSDISITDLCKRATVNRTTFYKHYQGVYEITEKLEGELLYKLFDLNVGDDINFIAFIKNPAPAFEKLNANLTSDLTYYQQMFHSERVRYIIDKINIEIFEGMKKQHHDLVKNNEVLLKTKINIAYFVGATTNLYLQWLRGDISCDVKDISDFISKVIVSSARFQKMTLPYVKKS
ncbi:MAG: TetR/AcrR family transcriptional regulator [Bacilli bacterium]|nr:TetR/AcrR family transcriptional regulator [Bacilli bacterium]